MATLTIVQKKSKMMPVLPHKLLINGQMVGIMQGERTTVKIPAGTFRVTIQSVIRFFSASRMVHVEEGLDNVLTFGDREKWWDLLMGVDMVLWVADLFVDLPPKWDLAYEIFTNGYLVLWLVYEWIIHKKYFRLEFYQQAKKEGIVAHEEAN